MKNETEYKITNAGRVREDKPRAYTNAEQIKKNTKSKWTTENY